MATTGVKIATAAMCLVVMDCLRESSDPEGGVNVDGGPDAASTDTGVDVHPDSDMDAGGDTDSSTDTDCGQYCDCLAIETSTTTYDGIKTWSIECAGGGSCEKNFGAVATTQEQLDVAWTAFRDPQPDQPIVDWNTEMVVVFATFAESPSCGMEVTVWDCGDRVEVLLGYVSDYIAMSWYAGAVVVIPSDDRAFEFHAEQLGGNCGDDP